MAKKELTFEEALAALEKTAADLRKDNISLEEAMMLFENGRELYAKCAEILNEAKQKIEIFTKEQNDEQCI